MNIAQGFETFVRDEIVSYGVSAEPQSTIEAIHDLEEHYYFPESRQSVEELFYTLAINWKNDVKLTSSATEIILNSFYQRIIGMGPIALPMILRELRRKPDHWFWALQSISGENPVRAQDRGKIKEMTQAWLKWGKEKGYLYDIDV
jgi:hypothetical protein